SAVSARRFAASSLGYGVTRMSIALPPSGRYRVHPGYGRVVVTVLRARCCPIVCWANSRPKYGHGPSRVSTGVVGRDRDSAGLMAAAPPTEGCSPGGGPCAGPPPPATPPAAAAPATTARNRTMPPVPASRPPGPYGFVGRSPTR